MKIRRDLGAIKRDAPFVAGAERKPNPCSNTRRKNGPVSGLGFLGTQGTLGQTIIHERGKKITNHGDFRPGGYEQIMARVKSRTEGRLPGHSKKRLRRKGETRCIAPSKKKRRASIQSFTSRTRGEGFFMAEFTYS